jgi:hypothetical protein
MDVSENSEDLERDQDESVKSHVPPGFSTWLSHRNDYAISPYTTTNTDGIRVSGSDCSITAATSIDTSRLL